MLTLLQSYLIGFQNKVRKENKSKYFSNSYNEGKLNISEYNN